MSKSEALEDNHHEIYYDSVKSVGSFKENFARTSTYRQRVARNAICTGASVSSNISIGTVVCTSLLRTGGGRCIPDSRGYAVVDRESQHVNGPLQFHKSMYRRFQLHLLHIATFLVGVALCNGAVSRENREDVRKFPEDLLFGTATASYQVEGAWDKDGKIESIWDHVVHTKPEAIKDGSNGDIACDSYHLYKRDVEMMRELGIDYTRFSISWPRILPNSFANEINPKGVEYYNTLIDEMLKYNIEPMATLYHWDLPQKLQELGGWTNPMIVDWYADYARVAFSQFGDRVKYWITINEPQLVCNYGYAEARLAPLLSMKGEADYMCVRNVLLAHAKAYHIYQEEFKSKYGGMVFISASAEWYEPEDETQIEAADEANQFIWAMYTHPIFSSTGDYPPIVKKRVAAKSKAQGYPRSRLIEFTHEEVEYIKGTADAFGLNHYSSSYVYRNESVIGNYNIPSLEDDLEVMTYKLDEWKLGESDFTKSVPWGFYKLLSYIRDAYDNPPVYVTENGYATPTGLTDDDRVKNYRGYMSAMLDAIDEGCNVKAYTAWSLMDNFEWAFGYTERFGLYEVDHDHVNRTRTPRKSAFVYKEMLRTRTIDYSYDPDPFTMTMTIDDDN